MLSFRRKLKDALRSTMTGMEITARAYQKQFREEFGCLRIMSVTISDVTVKYRKPCSRRRKLGLEEHTSVKTLANDPIWTEV